MLQRSMSPSWLAISAAPSLHSSLPLHLFLFPASPSLQHRATSAEHVTMLVSASDAKCVACIQALSTLMSVPLRYDYGSKGSLSGPY
jgi:hypothetical protein